VVYQKGSLQATGKWWDGQLLYCQIPVEMSRGNSIRSPGFFLVELGGGIDVRQGGVWNRDVQEAAQRLPALRDIIDQ